MGQVRSIWRRDKRRCWICLGHVAQDDASRDHVRPRSHGGYDKAANYRCAHVRCNSARGHLPVSEVIRVREELIEARGGRPLHMQQLCAALQVAGKEWDRRHPDVLRHAREHYPARNLRARHAENRRLMRIGRRRAAAERRAVA
jgi:hypothetical protein